MEVGGADLHYRRRTGLADAAALFYNSENFIMDEEGSSRQREHKVTAGRTNDPFDKMLSSMIGLPGGAHTKVAAVQHIDFYGHVTTFNIQSVKTDEGVTTFVTQADATGSVRYILPTKVLAAIDRQRASVSKQVRSRNGKRIAEERAAAGILPGFMKAK